VLIKINIGNEKAIRFDDDVKKTRGEKKLNLNN